MKFILIFALLFTTSVHSTESLGRGFYKSLLGNYPEAGSEEEINDFTTLMYYQNNRTEADCKKAESYKKVSLDSFYGGDNPLLSRKELRRLRFVFWFYFLRSGIQSQIAKSHFKRPRPFEALSVFQPCIKDPGGYAYPSGHATVSRVFARVLGKKFPERKEDFLNRANEIALTRVISGVHHPSDLVAGKKLGDYIATKILRNKQFLKILESY